MILGGSDFTPPKRLQKKLSNPCWGLGSPWRDPGSSPTGQQLSVSSPATQNGAGSHGPGGPGPSSAGLASLTKKRLSPQVTALAFALPLPGRADVRPGF